MNRRYIFIETGILHPWTSCLFCLGYMKFDDVQDSRRMMYKGTFCHLGKYTRIEILRSLEQGYVDPPVSFQIKTPSMIQWPMRCPLKSRHKMPRLIRSSRLLSNLVNIHNGI